MLLVSYDISDNKLRTRFAKFLKKFGYRLQYSVFQIDNSERMLSIINEEIKNNFEKQFSESDSVIIIRLNPRCEITRYGYAKNEEENYFIVE
ncbi:MAG: CRISPR-associated endonuclease Cas2 [Anaerovoracaceae bacterium]|jgi:CRISPR-associated protein Cas2